MSQRVFWLNPFNKNNGTIESDIRFLSSISVFDSLNDRHIEKIHRILHIRKYKKGEIVFREGDPGVGMYLVKQGSISVYKEFPDMTRLKIIDLEKGDFFGEIALLNDSPRSGTTVCTSETILYGLFRPDLLSLIDTDQKLGVKFIYRLSQIVAERLRLSNED